MFQAAKPYLPAIQPLIAYVQNTLSGPYRFWCLVNLCSTCHIHPCFCIFPCVESRFHLWIKTVELHFFLHPLTTVYLAIPLLLSPNSLYSALRIHSGFISWWFLLSKSHLSRSFLWLSPWNRKKVLGWWMEVWRWKWLYLRVLDLLCFLEWGERKRTIGFWKLSPLQQQEHIKN